MSDELYSLGIEVITQPAEESLRRISQITGQSVNSIKNSFDKITQGWDTKKIDLYAAALAKSSERAKELSKVSEDLLNISKTTGVPAEKLQKMWAGAESQLKKYEASQLKLYKDHYASLDKEMQLKKRNEIETERLLTKEYNAFMAMDAKKKAQESKVASRAKIQDNNQQNKLYQNYYNQLAKEIEQKRRNEIESERLITKEYNAYIASLAKKKAQDDAYNERKRAKAEAEQNRLFQSYQRDLNREIQLKRRNEIEAERLLHREYETWRALQERRRAQEERDAARRRAQAIRDQQRNNRDSLSAMSTISLPAMIVGGAAIGALTLAVKKNAEFEQSMAKVGAKADATASQLAGLKNAALDMTKYGFRVDEIVAAQDTLASMGFDAQKITQSLKAITVSARASGSDLNNVADMIAKVLNVYQLSADKATNVADILAMADIKSAANLQTMYYAMNYAAAPAKTLGISLEELSATIMELSNAGFRAETIGTSLKTGFIDLAKNADKLKKVGIDIKDANGEMKSLADIIDLLGKKMNGLSGMDKLRVLSTFIPKTAAAAWINLINQGSGQLREYTAMLKEVDGASEKLANTMQDNLMGDIQRLQGGFDKLTISGGGTLSPTLRILTQNLIGVVDALNKTDPATQSFVTGTIAGVGSTTLFIGAAAGLINTLGQLNIAFRALGFASFLNPLTLAIVGVGALTGAIMYHISAQAALKKSLLTTEQAEKALNAEIAESSAKMITNAERAGDLFNAFTRLAKSNASWNEKLGALMKMQDGLAKQFPQVAEAMNPWIEKYRKGQITVEQLTNKLREMIVVASIAAQKLALTDKMNTLMQQKQNYTRANIQNASGTAFNVIGDFAKTAIKNPFKANIGNSFVKEMNERQKISGKFDDNIKAINKQIEKLSSKKYIDDTKSVLDAVARVGSVGSGSSYTPRRNQSIKEAGLGGLMPKEKTPRTRKGKAALTKFDLEMNSFNSAVAKESETASDEGRTLGNERILELFNQYVKREDALQNKHINQKVKYDKKLAELKKNAIKTRLSEALEGFENDTANNTAREKYNKFFDITEGLSNNKSMPLLKKQMDEIAKTRKELLLKANEEDIKISEDNLKSKVNMYQLTNDEIYQEELKIVNEKAKLYKDVDYKKFADAEAEKTLVVRKEQERRINLTINEIERKKSIAQAAIDLEKQNLQFSFDMGEITNKQRLQALKVELDKEYNLESTNLKNILNLKRDLIKSSNPNASSERIDAILKETDEYKKYLNDQLKLDQDYAKNSNDIFHQMTQDRLKDWKQFTGSMKDSFKNGLSDMIQGNSSFSEAFGKMLEDLNKSFSDMLAKMIVDWASAQAKMVWKNTFTGGASSPNGVVQGGATSGIGNVTSMFGGGANNGGGQFQQGGGFTGGDVSPNAAVAGGTGNVNAVFSKTQSGWKSMLNVMKQHQGVFIAGSLAAWGMMAQGTTSKWALMASAAYSAIRFMFVAMKNAKAKEAWMDAFGAASGAWANAMKTYPFPLNLAIGAASAASAFAFPAAKAAAITAMSFDVGTMSVPKDMMAKIHKDEVIVPAKFSDRARAVLEGREGNNKNQKTEQKVINIHYNVNAVDAKGVGQFFDEHAPKMANSLRGEWKGGNYDRGSISNSWSTK